MSTPENLFSQRRIDAAVARLRVLLHVLVGREQKAAGAAGGVVHRLMRLGIDDLTIASISGRGVKYWPAPDFTSSALRSSRPS